MIRARRAAALLPLYLLFFPSPSPAADWKTGLLTFLGPAPDYPAALDFLRRERPSIDGEDGQTADALLPFLAGMSGEADLERDSITAYYETYRDNDPNFLFLEDPAQGEFLRFWMRWKSRFPLVSDLNLLSYLRSPETGLPASVEVGLDLLNDAFYKISLGPYVLEGGQWRSGFHILRLPISGLFGRSETCEFMLDLMAGDLVVRKPIRLRIEVATMDSPPLAAPAPAPVFQAIRQGQPAPPAPTGLEGEISLYVDGKLILRSRKIAAKAPPLSFPIPGPSMPGQKPYMLPPKEDPMARGVSILDALALAYKAIKDLTKKKPPKPSPPAYQKVTSLLFSFIRTDSEGQFTEARATVTLSPSKARVLRD